MNKKKQTTYYNTAGASEKWIQRERRPHDEVTENPFAPRRLFSKRSNSIRENRVSFSGGDERGH